MIRFRAWMACWMAAGMGLLATANAGAQVTKVGNAYLLRMKYAKGKTTRYQMTMQTLMPAGATGKAPPAMSVALPLTTTILNVQGDNATIKYDFGAMAMNGKAFSQPSTMQMTMNSRGQVVGQATGAGANMGLQNLSEALPEKPLKVGQSFTATKTVNQGGQNIQAKTTSTFMGIKNIGGQQVAEVATKMVGTGSAGMNGTGTSYFNVADGSLNSMKMTSSVSRAMPGQAQKMNMKFSVEMKTVGK